MFPNTLRILQQSLNPIRMLNFLQFVTPIRQSQPTPLSLQLTQQIIISYRSLQRLKLIHRQIKMLLHMADKNPHGFLDNLIIPTKTTSNP